MGCCKAYGEITYCCLVNTEKTSSKGAKDSHILVVPGVGFSLLCLARGFARGGVLNQSKSSIILKKSAIFAKQLSSSSFHMIIYARS